MDRKARRTREERFEREVGRKAARKRRAKEDPTQGVWFWLGMFGLVGWSVAVPTLVGVALGMWLDTISPRGPSWTLNLLIVGLILGCLIAWYWVQRESRWR